MDSQEISELSEHDLLEELQNCINEYTEWIDKEIELNNDWTEELEYLIFLRQDIHQLVEEIRKRGNDSFSLDTLIKLDAVWQSWCREHKDNNFRLDHTEPKKFWWHWIDKFDQLSDADLQTV